MLKGIWSNRLRPAFPFLLLTYLCWGVISSNDNPFPIWVFWIGTMGFGWNCILILIFGERTK